MELLFKEPELLIVGEFLLARLALQLGMLHDLPLTDKPLLVDLLPYGFTLLLLLSRHIFLLLTDYVKVLEIVFLFIDLCALLSLHLLKQIIAHLSLILSYLCLNGVLLFLELLDIVHDDFGPVVIVSHRLRLASWALHDVGGSVFEGT